MIGRWRFSLGDNGIYLNYVCILAGGRLLLLWCLFFKFCDTSHNLNNVRVIWFFNFVWFRWFLFATKSRTGGDNTIACGHQIPDRVMTMPNARVSFIMSKYHVSGIILYTHYAYTSSRETRLCMILENPWSQYVGTFVRFHTFTVYSTYLICCRYRLRILVLRSYQRRL